MVGDSGTSKTGQTYYYYTCNNKKSKKGCKTKSIKKDFLEDLVINTTKESILVPDVMNFISDSISQLQDENYDESMLNSMTSELKQVKANIKNLMAAIERGIITNTTKERLLELERRQDVLEAQIQIERKRIEAPKTVTDVNRQIVWFR